MKVQKLDHGVLILEHDLYSDGRGTVFDTYHAQNFGGFWFKPRFKQSAVIISAENALRGVNSQTPPQGRLITILEGKTFHVVIDAGNDTKPVLEHDLKAGQALWVPPGLAHGYYSVTASVALYQCTETYRPFDQQHIAWNDPGYGFNWPIPKGVEPVVTDSI